MQRRLQIGLLVWLLPALAMAAPVAGDPAAAARPGAPADAWQRFVPPADSRHDWLQLQSGEWLKGRLKSLYNFTLEFDSIKLKRLNLAWKDVQRLRTAAPRTVRVETERLREQPLTVIGRIELDGDAVWVIAGEHRQRFRRDRIVSIGNGGGKETDYWSGKFSLGANLRAGNADLVDMSLLANTRRLTAESRFVADYVGNFSRADGIETSNNHRLNGHYDRFQSRRFFWRVVNAEYYRDLLKNIAHQVSIGTAFGYDLVRDGRTDWELSGGVGVSYKRYVSVETGETPSETSPSLRLGTLYATRLNASAKLKVNYSFQILDKASGTYTHHFLATLSSDLWASVDLDLSFVWDRVQDPRPGADGILPERDDYQLIVGIGYDF